MTAPGEDAGRPPWWAAVLAALAVAYLALPLIGLGAGVPWRRFPALVTEPAALDALGLSLRTAAAALAIDLVLGVPLAVLLARRWRGVHLLRVLVLLPMALPPVVAGLALLRTFGRRGLLGPWLSSLGIELGFTTTAVVMAQVFVSLPFLVVALEAGLRSRDPAAERVAATLGASPVRVLRTVTLPRVAPALGRGAGLALARCLGEFGATLTFAGSLRGTTRTMPVEIYLARETDGDVAVALGVVLVLIAAVVVLLTELRWRAPGRARSRRLVPRRGEERPWCRAGRSVAAQAPAAGVPLTVRGEVRARGWAVDLDVPAGQVVAVLGANGSGKSTLAGVVSGLVPLDRGGVRLGDREIGGLPPHRRRVGLVAQEPVLFGRLSALDNAAYGPHAAGASRPAARARGQAELRLLHAGGLAGRPGGALSGGQAARVALARALATDPEILVLDEPFSALDATARADLLPEVAARCAGTTTLLVTHDLGDAMLLASRVIVLERGRVVEDTSPEGLLERPRSAAGARAAGWNVVGDLAFPACRARVVPPGQGRWPATVRGYDARAGAVVLGVEAQGAGGPGAEAPEAQGAGVPRARPPGAGTLRVDRAGAEALGAEALGVETTDGDLGSPAGGPVLVRAAVADGAPHRIGERVGLDALTPVTVA